MSKNNLPERFTPTEAALWISKERNNDLTTKFLDCLVDAVRERELTHYFIERNYPLTLGYN